MKCSICDCEIECCDGCSKNYEIDDDVIHDDFTGYHYCDWECHPNLQCGDVTE